MIKIGTKIKYIDNVLTKYAIVASISTSIDTGEPLRVNLTDGSTLTYKSIQEVIDEELSTYFTKTIGYQ